jgi:hypothetical protein
MPSAGTRLRPPPRHLPLWLAPLIALIGCTVQSGPAGHSSPTAALLDQPGRTDGLSVAVGRSDHFVLPVSDGQRLQLDALFDRSVCALDLQLRDDQARALAPSVAVDTGSQLVWTVEEDGLLDLHVTRSDPGQEGDCPYALGWSSCTLDPYEPNDSEDRPAGVVLPMSAFSMSLCDAEEEDWFELDGLEPEDMLSIRATFPTSDGDLDFFLYDPAGSLLASGESRSGVERLLHRIDQRGLHKLQVRLAEDAGGPGQVYDLDVFVRPFSTSCSADLFEPNDSPSAARPLTNRTYEDFMACADPDLYAFEVEAGVAVEIGLDFTHDEGDLDLTLLDLAGRELAASTSKSDDEHLSWTPTQAGTLLVRIELAEDLGGMPGNRYGLELSGVRARCIDDIYEPDDGPDQATAKDSGTYRDQTLCPGDDDWYRLELSRSEELILDLGYTAAEGNADLYLMDATGTEVIASGTTRGDDEHFGLRIEETGSYLLRVTLADDAGERPGNSYDLGVISIVHAACSPDDFEPNDGPEQARPLIDGQFDGLTLCPGESDWYAVRAGEGHSQIRLAGDAAGGEATMRLLDAAGAVVATGGPTSSGLVLDHEAVEARDLLLEIALAEGDEAATATYGLHVELGKGEAPTPPATVVCGPDQAAELRRSEATTITSHPHAAREQALCAPDGESWFELPALPRSSLVKVRLVAETAGVDLDLALFDPLGLEIAAGTNRGGVERLLAVTQKAGAHRLRITPVEAGSGLQRFDFDLDVSPVTTACGADPLEPNDGPGAASALEPGAWEALTVCRRRDDYYRLQARAGERLEVRIDFAHDQGDLDLFLLRDGTEVAASTGGNDDESVTHVAEEDGVYLVRVALTQDAGAFPGNIYALEVPAGQQVACPSDGFEPNDTRSAGAPLDDGEYAGMSVCVGEPDHYELRAGGAGPIAARLVWSAQEGEVDLRLFDPDGALVATAVPKHWGRELLFEATGEGAHVLEVRMLSDAGSSPGSGYLLEVQVPDDAS